MPIDRQAGSVEVSAAALATARERESATREVLQVISKSRDDYRPVFNVILKNALKLCDAPLGGLFLCNKDDPFIRMAAQQGATVAWIKMFQDDPTPADPSRSLVAEAAFEKKVVQIEDMRETDLYRNREPHRVVAVDEEGMRSVMAVPMLSGDECVGVILLYRREVRLFSESDIELVNTFADQGAIAIENVHQFQELQSRLEREAATREILHAISQSPDDDAPIFDTILKKSSELCNSAAAVLVMGKKGDEFQTLVAQFGVAEETVALYHRNAAPMDPQSSFAAQAILEGRIVHVHDMVDTEIYRRGSDLLRSVVEDTGVRTNLFVPLLAPEGGIGSLILFRHEVRPYTPDQIALVETFAAQAVIAIENVRRFKALETFNAELETRVADQVTEIERMGKLKRFLPAAVADTIVSQGSEKVLSSHRALLGVLFCDIRGFTAFCETAEPEETIEVLQTYHEEMGKLINNHGAGVDHRMGDGIMVLFNDPLPCEDPAGDAVRLAVAMRERMAEICKKWKRLGHRLGFGVGVSLGYATVGMVGYENRSDYTASGTAVNLAARLCDQAENGEILLSPRAYTAVEDDFRCEPTGEVNLKGIREPVEVYRLVAAAR